MKKEIKLRDLRRKEKYQVDDDYLNGYARLCGWQGTIVYNSLCRHSDKDQFSFPSIRKMAEQHGVSKDSIEKGIKSLKDWNIIHVQELNHKKKTGRAKQGLWKCNGYILLDKTEWRPKPVLPGRTGGTLTCPATTPSRVLPQPPDVSCQEGLKDTHKKDTHKKVYRESIEKSQTKDKNLQSLVEAYNLFLSQRLGHFTKRTPAVIKRQEKALSQLLTDYSLSQAKLIVAEHFIGEENLHWKQENGFPVEQIPKKCNEYESVIRREMEGSFNKDEDCEVYYDKILAIGRKNYSISH